MITHAMIAGYMSDNRHRVKFTREDLDFMKQCERGIQSGVRLGVYEGNVSTAATSQLVVARARKLLEILGYTSNLRQIGESKYLVINWPKPVVEKKDPEPEPEPVPPAA